MEVPQFQVLKTLKMFLILYKNYESNIVVVFSAFGETTDKLIKCGKLASIRDNNYKNVLKSILENHLKICKELFEVKNQTEILSHVQKHFNDLGSLIEGVYNLKEFSTKTYDTISGFGELLSYYIIGKLGLQRGIRFGIKRFKRNYYNSTN